MGTAKISGLGMALSPGDMIDWGMVRPLLDGEDKAEDALDMIGDGGAELGFLMKG